MLTAEAHNLLDQIGKRRYLIYRYRLDRHGPEITAAILRWSDYADVLVLRSDRRADAWRLPREGAVDELDPPQVVWWCGGGPVRVVGDLLQLPDPGQPLAPRYVMPLPQGAGLPVERRGAPVRVERRGT